MTKVLPWSKGKTKENSFFTKFDNVDFYLSIAKDLFENAIDFSSAVTTIEKQVIGTIIHSKKSFLYNNKEIRAKKDNINFDVTTRNFDSAEACELVGLYLLSILKSEFDRENTGL